MDPMRNTKAASIRFIKQVWLQNWYVNYTSTFLSYSFYLYFNKGPVNSWLNVTKFAKKQHEQAGIAKEVYYYCSNRWGRVGNGQYQPVGGSRSQSVFSRR